MREVDTCLRTIGSRHQSGVENRTPWDWQVYRHVQTRPIRHRSVWLGYATAPHGSRRQPFCPELAKPAGIGRGI